MRPFGPGIEPIGPRAPNTATARKESPGKNQNRIGRCIHECLEEIFHEAALLEHSCLNSIRTSPTSYDNSGLT